MTIAVELAEIKKDIKFLVDEHRENKADIKAIRDKLECGQGKISFLKANVKAIWVVLTVVTIGLLFRILV